MSSTALMDQAKAAIAALSNPSETNRANEWLVEFERSRAAWEVSDGLVREENGPYRFFGAKFLYSKVQKQYIQLDEASVNMLSQSLVQHILRISQDKNVEFNVCRYLCLALAALALQMNQSGILNQILQWLNPIISTNPNVLLELLIVLPEEAYNYQIDIASSARSTFIRQLTDSASDVLSFLSSLWPSVSAAIQAKILTCASKWIDTTSVPSDLIVANPIYHYITQSLSSSDNETFESAVDANIVILQRFRCMDSRILDTSLPVVVHLRSKWKHTVQAIGSSVGDDVDDDDRNTCRALCRVFTETAEACMELFLSAHTPHQGLQAELVHQLLDCTRIAFDASISRIPLKFFYDLAMSVRPSQQNRDQWSANSSNSALYETFGGEAGFSNSGGGQGDGRAGSKEEMSVRYAPIYQCLLEISLSHLVLPAKVLAGTVAIAEELQEERTEWKETVLDCCCVLGGPACMDLLCQQLQTLSQGSTTNSSSSNMDWARVESALVAMQTVVPYLDSHEATYTPQILAFVAGLPNSFLRLRITVIELFGKYAFWLVENPSYVNNVLGTLFHDLQQRGTCAAAAKATMNVFRTCSHLPGLPVQDLHQAVVHMRSLSSNNNDGAAVLTLESEIMLLEAIVSVLSQLPPPESESGFKMVLMPIVQALTEQLHTTSPAQAQLTAHVDRITVLFMCYRPQNANFTTELFISVLPLFQRMLQVCPSERVAEKCCRCYKHSMRNIGVHFVPHLSKMTGHLADQFASSPYSAFLYGCSTCISIFSLIDNGAHVDTLYTMLWKVSHTFFATLPTLQHFEHKPDVVEEYFFLMAKALQYCPAPFLNFSAEAATVIQAGLQGLSLRHREAQKGILLFFERFVQLSTFWPDATRGSAGAIGSVNTQAPTANPLNLAARAMVQTYAPALLAKIFTLLSGEMPAYALDESNGCISDVLWYMKKRFKDEFPVRELQVCNIYIVVVLLAIVCIFFTLFSY